MMWITQAVIPSGVEPSDWSQWHIGDPIPSLKAGRGGIVTFQADGDELWLILRAMKGELERMRHEK